jgi:AraC family transcriptional regulator of adaptative response / DNA-3-methyladenine glycosylase II
MKPAVFPAAKRAGSREEVVVALAFTPPYDWAAMLSFFRSHCIPGIETVTEDAFARVFRLGDVVGLFQVRAFVGEPKLRLGIVPGEPAIVHEVVRRVRRMFDLDCDPSALRSHFRVAPVFAALNRRYPGLRAPCGWDAFETSVCSILGQLVSARQRAQLIGQLVKFHGERIFGPAAVDTSFLFPEPRALAKAKMTAVRTTAARREAIRDFSRRVSSGAVSLSYGQDLARFRAALFATKGLGSWSVEYICLRAMADKDAFPKTDLILNRALALHPDLDLARLSPWRAYAATYLWREYGEALSRRRRAKIPASEEVS